MYVFHGLFAGAVKEGCDVLLLAEWGNFTFSDKGDWGFVEYLLNGAGANFGWRSKSSRLPVVMLGDFPPCASWPLLPHTAVAAGPADSPSQGPRLDRCSR